MGLLGWALLAVCLAAAASLITWSATDPSLARTAGGVIRNALGAPGANFADLAMRLFGLAAVFMLLPPVFWALQLISPRLVEGRWRYLEDARLQLMLAPPAVLLLASAFSALPGVGAWPLPYGLGGFLGDQTLRFVGRLLVAAMPAYAAPAAGIVCATAGTVLLVASLGMSLRDVWLLCQVGRPRFDLAGQAWRRLTEAGERADPAHDRREPVFDPTPEPRPARRQPTFSVEPAFELEPPARPGAEPPPRASGKGVHLRRPVPRDAEFDRATDAASQEMARRFAPPPAREEPSAPAGLGLFRRHWPPAGRDAGRDGGQPPPAPGKPQAQRRPVWPGSVPTPAADDAAPADPDSQSEEEEVHYRRAVALVRAHGKMSTTDLRQTLRIRYLLAARLNDRIEREGIVAARGARPIARSRIV